MQRKIFIKYCLLFLFFVLSIFGGKAQNTITFGLQDKCRSLTDDVCIFIDTNSNYSCNQIIEKYRKGSFNYRISDLPKYSNYTYWLALDIDNKKNEDVFLLVRPGFISYLNFYKTKNKLIIDSIVSGKKTNKTQYALNGINRFVFSLDTGKFIYFLKIKSDAYLPFTVDVLDRNTLIYKIDTFKLIDGLILGALILTFFYNLIIFFFARERLYIYYLLYVFFAIVLFLNLFSFNKKPYIFEFLSQNTLFFTILFFLSAILFVREFLIQSPIFKKQKKIILVFFILGVLCIISGFFVSASKAFSLLIIYTGLLHLYLFIISVYLFKKDDISSILFSAAWLLVLSIFIYVHIIHTYFLPYYMHSVNLIMYGRVLNIILLSLVIGNRLNMYSIKEKKARAKELSAIRERDRIIAGQQEKLRRIVEERNKEILEKIKELSKQQEELEKQTHEISEKNIEIVKYNKELDIKNKKIEEQNKVLEEYKQELEKIVEIRKKELQIEMERAEVANKLKTSFLNNLSNEIRTPLNAITDFATLLVHKNTDKNQRNELLQAIIQNTETLLSLIEDVLTLSRIQSGIVKLKKSEFKPEELIYSLVDDFKDKLFETDKKNLKIQAKIPKNNKFAIVHDYDKIWQIFNQLISNSIQFTDKGYIEIAYSIEPINENSGKILFYVKDTGKGMSEKEINEFLHHYQNKNYHKKGLGLAIVKEFIKLFGGTIRVKSEINQGTIFYFEFETDLKTTN